PPSKRRGCASARRYPPPGSDRPLTAPGRTVETQTKPEPVVSAYAPRPTRISRTTCPVAGLILTTDPACGLATQTPPWPAFTSATPRPADVDPAALVLAGSTLHTCPLAPRATHTAP